MGTVRCCCDKACLIFKDGFARADSTLLGGLWQELYGDWAISSGVLQAFGNALAVYALDQPQGEVSHLITVRARGDEVERFANIVIYEDSDNYLVAQLEFGDTTGSQCGTMRLIENGITIHESTIAGVPIGEWVGINVCYQSEDFVDGGVLWMTATGNSGSRTIAEYATGNGLRVGLGAGEFGTGSGTGTGSTGRVSFDDFKWYKLRLYDPEAGTGTGTGNSLCSICFLCEIWEADVDTDSDSCEQTITGTPFDTANSSSWEITSHSTLSQYEIENGVGILVELGARDNNHTMVLTLGNYTATFVFNATTPKTVVTLSGPGVSVTSDEQASATHYSFAYINGSLCASVMSGSAATNATATPPGSIASFPISVSANDNGIVSVVLSRCPTCVSAIVCSRCNPTDVVPQYLRIRFEGITDGSDSLVPDGACTNCNEVLNGSFVLTMIGACTWSTSEFVIGDCTYKIDLLLTGTSPIFLDVQIHATLAGETVIHFKKTYPSNPPCIDWDSEQVSFSNYTGLGPPRAKCHAAGALCFVTGL